MKPFQSESSFLRLSLVHRDFKAEIPSHDSDCYCQPQIGLVGLKKHHINMLRWLNLILLPFSIQMHFYFKMLMLLSSLDLFPYLFVCPQWAHSKRLNYLFLFHSVFIYLFINLLLFYGPAPQACSDVCSPRHIITSSVPDSGTNQRSRPDYSLN